MLASIVEFLVTTLIGVNCDFYASTLFVDEDNRLTFVDPKRARRPERLLERIEVLMREMLAGQGVRLPGACRETLATRVGERSFAVSDVVLAALEP